MKKLARSAYYLLRNFLEGVGRSFGYDMCIDRDDTTKGILDFEIRRDSPSCAEYFGLGHRVVVSNMRIHKAMWAQRSKAEAQ